MAEVRSRQEVTVRLRQWLAQRRGLQLEAIQEDTDIIEERILESLQLVDFILFIENESGRAILSEQLDPRKLRTVGTIFANFFEEQGG